MPIGNDNTRERKEESEGREGMLKVKEKHRKWQGGRRKR